MAKSFKIATNEFIQQTLGGELNPNKTLKDPLKCPTYGELKEGVNFVYTDGTTLGIQWRGTVNGEDYTDEYDSNRCLAEIDIEKLNAHDFRIYTNSGLTETTMSADCMTTAEDISGKTRYEADRLNENFLYPTYSQSGDVKWHEFDDSNEQKTVTVNLSEHGSWTTYSENPDSTLYNAYMSNSSKGNANAYDLMVISIPTGFTDFTIRIRSYAETTYDYTIAGNIDAAIPNSNTVSDNLIKSTTSGNQKAGTAIGDYTIVEYTNIDSTKEHTIWVMYRKDGSTDSGDDRGYVLIPKSNDYVIKEGVGSLRTANVNHSRVVPISACTLTYSGGDGKPIHERWDTGSTKYTLSGNYKGLTSQNDVTISQSGETYGYYADSAHTQWVSANTLDDSHNSPWYTSGKYGYYLENSSLENFYSNLQKQYGWLNDFGDNSGTTNGRDEYNMDSTNYSSGTSLTWGGSTVGNIVNAKNDFDNNNNKIMGETISSAKTETYHMAFSNDMWYSGNTVPTEINDKHNFYWIFLDESVTHDVDFNCDAESQRLRGDKDTSNDNYSISYERTYFKPLHCYGKTSIDRMYKHGTTTYDKGTTSLNWLQGNYPKHFKRVVLQTVANIYPYDYYYSTEINKLKLNSHVIVLESQNNSTYSASTRVKATSGQSNTYTTSAQAYDKEYKFYPRFIMMSPEQYSADTTNSVFGQIVSGQELSYNEHQSGDTYDYNIKKDNNAIITKEKLNEPFVSYKGVFTQGTNCSTTWPSEIFYYPKIYHFEAKKDVTNGKCYYKLGIGVYITSIDNVKNLIEKTLTEDEWTNLSEHTGYTEDNTYGYLSNATQYQSGTANGISFTDESTQQGRDDYGYAYTSYTYTLTSNTTIDEYVSSPGTILKINYSDGNNIETQILESTGTTINVNTRIDTGKEISSIEYKAITNYEYAIYDTTGTSVSVKYATFSGLNFYAYDSTDDSDVPVYSIEKKDGITDFTGNTTVVNGKEYETGEIKLIDEISRELKVYLEKKTQYYFTYEIDTNTANKYNEYYEFIHYMITNYSYMKSINKDSYNKDTYWVSDAWDDNNKYVSFS